MHLLLVFHCCSYYTLPCYSVSVLIDCGVFQLVVEQWLNTEQPSIVQLKRERRMLTMCVPPSLPKRLLLLMTVMMTLSPSPRVAWLVVPSLPWCPCPCRWHPCPIRISVVSQCLCVSFGLLTVCNWWWQKKQSSILYYRSHTIACTTTRRMLPCKQSYWHQLQVNRGHGTIQVRCSLD